MVIHTSLPTPHKNYFFWDLKGGELMRVDP